MSISPKISARWRWLAMVLIAVLLCAGYCLYGVKVQTDLGRAGHFYCGYKYPIRVTVYNFTFKRLAKVSLTLEGWRDGRSADVLSNNRFVFDAVVKPFTRETQCFEDDAFYTPRATPTEDGSKEQKINMDDVIKDMAMFDQKTRGVEIIVKDVEPEFY